MRTMRRHSYFIMKAADHQYSECIGSAALQAGLKRGHAGICYNMREDTNTGTEALWTTAPGKQFWRNIYEKIGEDKTTVARGL